ncbi:MAG TPA: hypothetical protein VMG60_19985 [Burkholderiaceae bacterium]|nr:hypothetical protein [Burkholderiaceae bacterium]
MAAARTNVGRAMATDMSLIAVVDDEESVRKALGRLVRSAAFDVEKGRFALRHARSAHAPRERTRCPA